ncbi:MAG: sulfurtransferase-like selenium metabolism protein YedF [Pseudomonadota bacterium]
MKEIDCRGLPCPQPVLRTKQALDELVSGRILVIVDNEAARGNILRFSESQGHKVQVEKKGREYSLTIEKNPAASGMVSPEAISCRAADGDTKDRETVIVFCSDQMGIGEPELGGILLQAFLKTLPELDHGACKLIFYNRGVFLTTQSSAVLDVLQRLEGRGMELFVCGTCLDYYHLKERLAVGAVSNMFTILDAILKSAKVIYP